MATKTMTIGNSTNNVSLEVTGDIKKNGSSVLTEASQTATTTANGLMSSSDKSKLNGIESGAIRIHKALTSNGTTATTDKGKTYGIAGVTTSPYTYSKWYAYLDSGTTSLTNGMIISIRIPVAGCSYGCAISIDGGTTFKPVVKDTNSRITTHFGNGVELILMYDSNQTANVYNNSASETSVTGVWRVINMYDSGNTYTQCYCSTGGGTAAKVGSCTNYILLANSYLMVTIVNSNTVAGAITLNVNSKGAKPIYINGSASSSSNHTLPAGTYLVFYNGTNYYFRTDGKITGNITGSSTSCTGNSATSTSANYPKGFAAQYSTIGDWGIQTGELITGWTDGSGGEIRFQKNCPGSGQTSVVVDGAFYQNEGQYKCLDESGGTMKANSNLTFVRDDNYVRTVLSHSGINIYGGTTNDSGGLGIDINSSTMKGGINPLSTTSNVKWKIDYSNGNLTSVGTITAKSFTGSISGLTCTSANYGGSSATTSVQTALNNLSSSLTNVSNTVVTVLNTLSSINTKLGGV